MRLDDEILYLKSSLRIAEESINDLQACLELRPNVAVAAWAHQLKQTIQLSIDECDQCLQKLTQPS